MLFIIAHARRLYLFLLVFAGVAGPALVGIPVGMNGMYFLAGALLLAAWAAIGKPAGRGRRALAVVVAFGFSLSLADLAGRRLLRPFLYRSPLQIFARVWPPIPVLNRYAANVNYEGETYGDLADRSARKEFRVGRRVTFRTDGHGFRNDPAREQLDLVLLGDSFGVGSGARQEKMWASLFLDQYGLHTYNLSVSFVSPWKELLTLKAESDRLRLSGKTVVLWALFTGNDLDEDFGDVALPARQPWWAQLHTAFAGFRARSPVANLVHRVTPSRRAQEAAARQEVIVRNIAGGRKMLFWTRYIAAKDRSPAAVMAHQNYPRLVEVFDEMNRVAGAKGFTVGVALVPTKEEVYAWLLDSSPPATSGFSVVIRDLCTKEGYPFLDLGPFFAAAARELYGGSGELLFWPDDTHWNERGQELAAAVVYERLLRPIREGRGLAGTLRPGDR